MSDPDDALDLIPMSAAHLDALHAIFSDPAGWWFDPEGRHAEPAETLALIERSEAGWRDAGLSYWTAMAGGDVVGMGGVRRKDDTWNLAYRFASAHQGKGYATEIARAGVAAAHAADSGIPVLAWVDPVNAASIRVAEKAHLTLQGMRPDPTDGVERLV